MKIPFVSWALIFQKKIALYRIELNTNHCCHSNSRIIMRYAAACDLLTILIMHIQKFLLQLVPHWNQIRLYTAFAPCLWNDQQIISFLPWICFQYYCKKNNLLLRTVDCCKRYEAHACTLTHHYSSQLNSTTQLNIELFIQRKTFRDTTTFIS